MTRPRIEDVPPEKQAVWRDNWRESKRRQRLNEGAGKQIQEIIRNEALEAELLAFVTLLHETVDRRPGRFFGVLQESLPRLRAARQHMKPLTLAAKITDHLISTIELMPRRGIR